MQINTTTNFDLNFRMLMQMVSQKVFLLFESKLLTQNPHLKTALPMNYKGDCLYNSLVRLDLSLLENLQLQVSK